MAAAIANLVLETSTGIGTGNLTLASLFGKQTFATAFGTGATQNVFFYFISSASASDWEVGTGHMSDATTLVRDTVILSSNANALVSLAAGTKYVSCDLPASYQTQLIENKFNAGIFPASDDGAAIGNAATLRWSDLFLASGGVINWNNGDVTLAHSANALAFAGASSGYSFDALISPAADDGAPLGSTAKQWSDAFFATGAVHKWNNSETITHQAGGWTFAAGVATNPLLTLAPKASSIQQGLVVTQSGTTTTSASDFGYNTITINNDGRPVTGGNLSTAGLSITLNSGGATAAGTKRSFWGTVNNAYASSNTGGDFIGISGWAISNQSNGGTNTGAGALGTLYGMEAIAHAFSGATNYAVIGGLEIDAIIDSGATAKHRWGASIVGNGAVRGASTDAALEIGAVQAAGAFTYGILFDNVHGQAPLPTTGVVFGTDGSSVTLTDFANFSTYTFTGNLFNFGSPFAMTGAGVITGATWHGVAVAGLYGGTGLSTAAVGDLMYASATTPTWARLADVATGNALISGGVNIAPSWGKIGLTTHISGVLAEANGGVNQSSYTLGDLLYASATNTLAKLAGNTTTTKKYLSQTGNGSVSAAPAWAQIAVADLSNGTTGSGNIVLATSPTISGGTGAGLGKVTFWQGGYVTARYYGALSGGASSTAYSANVIYFYPLVVGETHTFDRIAINVATTGTAVNARLAIYNAAGGIPTSLVVDGGTVAVGTTGVKTVTISQSLSPGMYYLAVELDGTCTLGSQNNVQVLPYYSGQADPNTFDSQLSATFTFAAFPANMTFGSGGVGAATYTAANSPLIMLRA